MSLKAIQFKIHVKQEEDLFLPEFSGSMLRGAFGHALRRIACITRMPDCKTCPLKQSCSYIRIFETEKIFDDVMLYGQAQNPYTLQVAHLKHQKISKNQHWSFSMTLMGQAIQDLAIAMFAWQKALERGLTHQRIVCQLINITQNNQVLYDPTLNKIFPADIQECIFYTEKRVQKIVLNFESPLRIKHNEKYILEAQKVTAQHILLKLFQRIKRYSHQQNTSLPTSFEDLKRSVNQIQGQAINLKKSKVTRYSNRQKQYIHLEGLVGLYELEGELDQWLPLLEFGQMIHIGKNATHGLGQYKILEVH